MRKSLRSSAPTEATGACAALASTLALGVFAWTMPALGEPTGSANRAKYATLESFSSEFGSKFASGYFVSQTGRCLVTLMVTEKQDPDLPVKTTAARVRLELNPGQMAGVDSEERQSLNFTCAPSCRHVHEHFGVRVLGGNPSEVRPDRLGQQRNA